MTLYLATASRPLRLLAWLLVAVARYVCGLSLHSRVWEAALLQQSWQQSGQQTLCINGTIVPELYVIGAMKSGTTSLSNYLFDQNMTTACAWGVFSKECAFFNAGLNNIADPMKKKQEWLRQLNFPCPAAGTPRQVFTDLTPSYLHSVPEPPSYNVSGIKYGTRSECLQQQPPAWCILFSAHASLPPPGVKSTALENMNAPKDMASVYGSLKKNITLAVVLREPLSRAQSHWYFGKTLNYQGGCTACAAPSFSDALNRSAARYLNTTTPVLDDYLWPSMYAYQLKEWLKHFSASQFVIMPNNFLMDVNKSAAFCQSLSSRLGFPMDCQNFLPTTSSGQVQTSLSTSHPALEDDVSPQMTSLYQTKVFGAPNTELFQVLASMQAKGAVLQGYNGTGPATAAGVKAWLAGGW